MDEERLKLKKCKGQTNMYNYAFQKEYNLKFPAYFEYVFLISEFIMLHSTTKT